MVVTAGIAVEFGMTLWAADILRAGRLRRRLQGFWLTTWAPLAIASLLVSGRGIALLYPLGLSRAIDASDGPPELAAAASARFRQHRIGDGHPGGPMRIR